MVLFFSIVKIKVKFVCFLRGGDYHIVGFRKVYRKFIG